MTTAKNLTTALLLLMSIALYAQDTDSAFAMLAEISAEPSAHRTTLESESIIAKKLNTTKHANFRTSGSYQSVDQYLSENLKFPDEAKILGKTGVVKVVFDILPDGSVENISVLEAPLQLLSDELIKTLKAMPKWSPAYQSGIAVKTRQQVNVDFSLL